MLSKFISVNDSKYSRRFCVNIFFAVCYQIIRLLDTYMDTKNRALHFRTMVYPAHPLCLAKTSTLGCSRRDINVLLL